MVTRRAGTSLRQKRAGDRYCSRKVRRGNSSLGKEREQVKAAEGMYWVLLAVGLRVPRFSVCVCVYSFLACIVCLPSLSIEYYPTNKRARLFVSQEPNPQYLDFAKNGRDWRRLRMLLSYSPIISYICELILLTRAKAQCRGAARDWESVENPLFNVCFVLPHTSFIDNFCASIRPIYLSYCRFSPFLSATWSNYGTTTTPSRMWAQCSHSIEPPINSRCCSASIDEEGGGGERENLCHRNDMSVLLWSSATQYWF